MWKTAILYVWQVVKNSTLISGFMWATCHEDKLHKSANKGFIKGEKYAIH